VKIRYVGPYASVHVPALGVVVERGEQIDVERGTAESLCEQATWEKVPTRSKKGTKE